MSVQARIDDYWTGRAPAYDAWQRHPERVEEDVRCWSDIWAGALPPAPLDVLDVGTGSGQVACVLADLGHRVTAVDLSAGMLEQARRNAAACRRPPRVLEGDAVAPPFPDGSFDVLTARYVMWTLRDPLDAVAAWRRVLRPGGTVALVDTTWFPDGVDPEGVMAGHYDAEVLAALPLAEAGSIERTAETLAAGGLEDVTVIPLTTLLDLDRRRGVAPDHDVRLQYLVSGRTPDGCRMEG